MVVAVSAVGAISAMISSSFVFSAGDVGVGVDAGFFCGAVDAADAAGVAVGLVPDVVVVEAFSAVVELSAIAVDARSISRSSSSFTTSAIVICKHAR